MKILGWLAGLTIFTSVWAIVTHVGFFQLMVFVLIINTLGFFVRKNLK